ncbi:MAG: DUF6356 family protein [Flavobacteriaceae bacterium]
MKNIFTHHPKSVGENYFQHFFLASSIGLKLILWGLVACVHGLFPFLFETFVSDKITGLYEKIIRRNQTRD